VKKRGEQGIGKPSDTSRSGIGVVLKQLLDEHKELGLVAPPAGGATVIVSIDPPLKRT